MNKNYKWLALSIVATSVFFSEMKNKANAVSVYLNDQNISVSLGSNSIGLFSNLSEADSLANVIDAPSATAPENHVSPTTHVWWTGTQLELEFDLGTEYNLTTLHFWNYFGEDFDVDNIDFSFFDSSNNLVGTLNNVQPLLGGGGSNPIFAENYNLSFPSNIQFVNAILTGTNNQVDFNNIGFTGEVSNPPGATGTPEPSTILSLLSLGILGGVSRFKSTKK